MRPVDRAALTAIRGRSLGANSVDCAACGATLRPARPVTVFAARGAAIGARWSVTVYCDGCETALPTPRRGRSEWVVDAELATGDTDPSAGSEVVLTGGSVRRRSFTGDDHGRPVR